MHCFLPQARSARGRGILLQSFSSKNHNPTSTVEFKCLKAMPISKHPSIIPVPAAVTHGAHTAIRLPERNVHGIQENVSLQLRPSIHSGAGFRKLAPLAAGSLLLVVFLMLRCFRIFGHLKRSGSPNELSRRRLASIREDCGNAEGGSLEVGATVDAQARCNRYMSAVISSVIGSALHSVQQETLKSIDQCAVEALKTTREALKEWASTIQKTEEPAVPEFLLSNEVYPFQSLVAMSKAKEKVSSDLTDIVDVKLQSLRALVSELRQNQLSLRSEVVEISEALKLRGQLKHHCQQLLFEARDRLPRVLSELQREVALTESGPAAAAVLERLGNELQELKTKEMTFHNADQFSSSLKLRSVRKMLHTVATDLHASEVSLRPRVRDLLAELLDIIQIIEVAQQGGAVEAGEIIISLLRKASRSASPDLLPALESIESTIDRAAERLEYGDNASAKGDAERARLELESVTQTLETIGEITSLKQVKGAAYMLRVMTLLIDSDLSTGTEKEEISLAQRMRITEEQVSIPLVRVVTGGIESDLPFFTEKAFEIIAKQARLSRQTIHTNAESMKQTMRIRVATCIELLCDAMNIPEAIASQGAAGEDVFLNTEQTLKAPLIGLPTAVLGYVKKCDSLTMDMPLESEFKSVVDTRVADTRAEEQILMAEELEGEAIPNFKTSLDEVDMAVSGAMSGIQKVDLVSMADAPLRSALLDGLSGLQQKISETKERLGSSELADWDFVVLARSLEKRLLGVVNRLGNFSTSVPDFVSAAEKFSNAISGVELLLQNYMKLQVRVATSLLRLVKQSAELGEGSSPEETALLEETRRLVDKALSNLDGDRLGIYSDTFIASVAQVITAQTYVVDLVNLLERIDDEEIIASAYGAFFVLKSLFFDHLAPRLI